MAEVGLVRDGKVEFHYQKTSQYRGVHADGFWGGPTPRGMMAISFFSERQPIPRRAERPVVSEVGDLATLGEENVSDTLSGLVRQVETTIYMDIRTAQELYSWLGPHVAAMERRLGLPLDQRVTKDEG